MAMPAIGDLVRYRLDIDDCAVIRRRRKANGGRHGTPVHQGELVALVVTVAADGIINGQAVLDGDDSHWVVGASEGDTPGTWMR